jgi:hypothetical protein
MRSITKNCLTVSVNKAKLKPVSFYTTLCCIAGLFFSTAISAQTFPTSCTSKDLTLLSASLPAPANNRCQCSGDRSLILGIRNGTGSFRTSFALWGTLIRKNSNGVIIQTASLFACASGIQPKSDNFLNAATIKLNGVDVTTASIAGLTLPVLHIDCGESLDITNMHLAWTSASPTETCDLLYANPGTINPKCGTQDLIHVGIGVTGTVTPTNATCTALGKIKIAPFGGLPPYQVCLDNGSCQNVADGGFYEFTGVAAGAHTIQITDNMGRPVAERCTISLNQAITQPQSVDAPTVTTTQPDCSNSKGKCVITAPIGTGYTYSIDGQNYQSGTTFDNLNPANYTITAKLGGCTSAGTGKTINQPPAPPSFTVCLVQPTLCAGANSGGSITVNASGGSNFMYKLNNGTAQSGNVFSNLGAGSVSGITVTNGDGCSVTVSCSNFTLNCGAALTKKELPVRNDLIVAESKATVKAYPNPFNDKVKFVVNSPDAGKGSLEVYNIMGQKIKTVFQGHINAGDQSFEMNVSKKQQSTLIYIFRVGDKQVTGKLLQINN